jgi:hypothetical protein
MADAGWRSISVRFQQGERSIDPQGVTQRGPGERLDTSPLVRVCVFDHPVNFGRADERFVAEKLLEFSSTPTLLEVAPVQERSTLVLLWQLAYALESKCHLKP